MAKVNCARLFTVMVLAGLSCIGVAHADLLADPTRPAPEWLAAQPPVPGGEVVGNSSAPRVQVIVIGRSRKFAIIDGQLIRYGDTYNGSRLAGIHPDGVVMQKDGSKEKLSMSPAVEKKVRVSKPVTGRVKSEKNVVNGEGQ